MICPHLVYPDIEHIPFAALKKAGFLHVVFDKDNTLTDHDVHEFLPTKYKAFAEAQSVFGEQNVGIFTNHLKIRSITHKNKLLPSELFINWDTADKKPFCLPHIEKYFRHRAGVFRSDKLVVVGDRLLTDVALGKQAKGLSVYVLPWHLSTEQPGIKFSRRIENFAWEKVYNNRLETHGNPAIQQLAASKK